MHRVAPSCTRFALCLQAEHPAQSDSCRNHGRVLQIPAATGGVPLATTQCRGSGAPCCAQASDELRLGVDGKPHFSPAFQKLVAFQARRPHMALIDPLANVQKVGVAFPIHTPLFDMQVNIGEWDSDDCTAMIMPELACPSCDFCRVPPVTSVVCHQVLDRAALLAMLGGLAALAAPGAAPGLLRPPAHVTVRPFLLLITLLPL